MLRGRAYGESDKIVTFLTRDFGKLSGIAKGAAKSKRRFVGSLEPFTHVALGFRSRRDNDLCFIESADIVRSPRRTTLDLDRYAYSTYAVELLDSMVEGREGEAAIFDLAESMLEHIDSSVGPPMPEWLRRFEVQLLKLIGLDPNFERCRRCQRAPELAAEPEFRFDPRTGVLLCYQCQDGTGVAVSGEALRHLIALRNGGAGNLPRGNAAEVRVLLQSFIAYHVRRPLRSPALLREILGA